MTSTTTSTPPINRWAVLWSSVAVLMCTGAIYAFSVLAGPLSAAHDWTMPQVMMAFTINAAVGPIPMILGGILTDRGWTRWLVLVGGLMFASGFALTGTASSLTTLYLSYGVLAGLGQGLAYSGCLGNVMKLFPDRRGLAAGLITGGMGAASVIAAPVANAIIAGPGVRQAFVWMGLAYAVVVVVASFFLRAAPVGFVPAGWTPPAGRPTVQVRWSATLRTPAFWSLFVMMALGAFSGLMIASNASPIGQNMFGLTAATAAVFVSVYSACNALGRVVWGAVSDRLGYTTALMIIYTVVAVCMLVLVTVSSTAGFAIGIIGLGLCFGGVMGVFPALTMTNFGPRFQGINYALVFVAYSVSAFFAPRLASGMAAGRDGDFTVPFVISIVLALVGVALTAAFRRIQSAHLARLAGDRSAAPDAVPAGAR
ncbi:L-lactate MFS transporter [Cellulomonas endometrii]|uniref:L-lactate MFS transporter n=1 Tax=Cellulomonas endometrii TaxID=3036301 RepID=UPI0024ACF07E|nr:OFA family MFS transporter [Cellulomonas endometrii]